MVEKGFKHGDPQTNALANGGQYIAFQRVGIKGATTIFFKGYFKSFEDTYTSDFEETTPYGRMDPIMNFKRTGRKITVSFDVVAGDLEEAQNNLFKIQKLAQFLYPNYDGDNPSLIKNSPMFKVKMMNLVANNFGGYILCTLGGFSYAPNLEDGAFFREDRQLHAFPKSVTISTTITPLHEHNLGFENDQFMGSGFPYGNLGSVSESEWQVGDEGSRISEAKTSSSTSVNGSNVNNIKQQQVLQGSKENAAAKARAAVLARERERTGETKQQQQNRLAQEVGVRGGTRTR